MSNVAADDILEFKSYTLFDSQLGLNVHHYRVISATEPEVPFEGLAGAWSNRFHDELKDLMTDAAEFRGASCQNIYPAAPTAIEYSDANAGFGTAGSTPMPKQICGLISWRSTAAGRTNRGRTYVPFPDQADDDGDGVPDTPYLVTLGQLAVALSGTFSLITEGVTVELMHVIWAPGSILGRQVANWLEVPAWATQRRRGDFGAKNVSPI